MAVCVHMMMMMMMMSPVAEVALDPDTAHPNIVLSADGKRAWRGEPPQEVPDNPGRFDPVICVAAQTGFLSGRFYFQVGNAGFPPWIPAQVLMGVWLLGQVEVGAKTSWDLGVVRESAGRKGLINLHAGERLLDGEAEERGRVPGAGLAVRPPGPAQEASRRSACSAITRRGGCPFSTPRTRPTCTPSAGVCSRRGSSLSSARGSVTEAGTRPRWSSPASVTAPSPGRPSKNKIQAVLLVWRVFSPHFCLGKLKSTETFLPPGRVLGRERGGL